MPPFALRRRTCICTVGTGQTPISTTRPPLERMPAITSGEMVKHAVIAGILSSGGRVVDIGVCPVPTVQMQVRRRRANGGIAITASHNPAEWNALKFIGANGLFLDGGQARELLDIYHQGEYTQVTGEEMRSVEEAEGATDAHIKAVMYALGPL